MGEGEPAVNALPKTSELVTAPAKVISPRKAWMLLSLLLSISVYMLVSLIYIQSTQGWIFIDPGIYQAGVVVSAVVAVLLIYSMRGRGSVLFSNVLVVMLGTFPVLLMLLVPLLSVAPLHLCALCIRSCRTMTLLSHYASSSLPVAAVGGVQAPTCVE